MANRRLIALSASERAMKIQEIILKAMSGEIKWCQAAQIIGISGRQMRRWKARYDEFGYDGLYDRRKNLPSPKKIPMQTAEKILRLYREQYFDFNMRHFHQELKEKHGVSVSYTWTRGLLQGAGLVLKGKRRGQYRRRRERRPMTGMLLHLDGSFHRWFEHPLDERQTLLSVIDDANSECLGAVFVPQEATRPILGLLLQIVRKHGTFISLYTDRAAHFVHTPKAGEPPDRTKKTQIEKVLDELGIELIVAKSPEARGRSERAFGTMQGRLVPELRRAGITTYEEANRYLQRVFIPKYNRYFGVASAQADTAFIPVIGANLNRIFSIRYERTINKDNTVQLDGKTLQLPKIKGVSTLARRKVEVREHLDGIWEVLSGKRVVARINPNRQAEAVVLWGLA